ncbi:MAG: diacylglycerol/lipid kinase family protein [Solirubrobacterales bacterium]
MSERSFVVLINPNAGKGRGGRQRERAEAALTELGAQARFYETTGMDDAVQEAQTAAQAGETPVVMSGDGVVGAVGGALADRDMPMGILPAGRGNDLARVLGIPRDIGDAARVLVEGHVRTIDVGEANGTRFLGIASAGFDSDANRLANEAETVRGPLVYLYAALRALAAWEPASFTVEADGHRWTFSGYSVAAANSKAYGGGMFLAPDADLTDGRFDVVTIGETPKIRFARTLPLVFKGTHVGEDPVSVSRARRVRFEADREFDVYADGERITSLPVTIDVLPAALGVIAPAPES